MNDYNNGEVSGKTVNDEPKSTPERSLYDIVETFCVAVFVMLLLFMFVFRYVTVVGTSMTDTLDDGDKLIISNLFYTPKTGDIIVISTNTHPLIKRVIATGGQNVKIDFETWQVWVSDDKLFDDGDLLKEDDYVKYMYSAPGQLTEMLHGAFVNEHLTNGGKTCEFTVPEGEVFVMGDNRNGSTDSRARGCFPCREIVGHVIFRVAPRTGTVK